MLNQIDIEEIWTQQKEPGGGKWILLVVGIIVLIYLITITYKK